MSVITTRRAVMSCRVLLFWIALLAAVPSFAAETFLDCPVCPEMVVVPAGSFNMGSPEPSKELRSNEGPNHRVTIGAAFAVGIHAVTFAQWDACLNDGGCGGNPQQSEDWGRSNRPAIYVSWDDAQSYVHWLNDKLRLQNTPQVLGQKTTQAPGQKPTQAPTQTPVQSINEAPADSGPYRLLSEAEWEYAARAGTTTPYYWGAGYVRGSANCDGCGSEWDNKQTAPVGSFAPNAFGLFDMAGNVLQWVQDCYHDTYTGAPTRGAAWQSSTCAARVMRGGSWFNSTYYIRASQRYSVPPNFRANNGGFRVAKTLN